MFYGRLGYKTAIEANQALPPTPVGRLGTAFVVDIIGPA